MRQNLRRVKYDGLNGFEDAWGRRLFYLYSCILWIVFVNSND